MHWKNGFGAANGNYEQMIQTVLDAMDTDKDGKLSFEDFYENFALTTYRKNDDIFIGHTD